MLMFESSLKKRYGIKLLASVVSGVIGMILVAIVPKAIGPVSYGQFVYLQQFFSKIISFLDASSSIAFFTKISANNKRKELIGFYLYYTLFILLSLVFFIAFFNYFDLTKYILPEVESKYFYLALFFSFLTWFVQIATKVSDAYALTVYVEIMKIIHKFMSLVLLIYVISFFSLNLSVYLYLNIATLLIFVFCVIWIFKSGEIVGMNVLVFDLSVCKSIFREFLSYCSPLFAYSTLALILGLFDIWLLQHISGAEETGYYGVSYSIAAMCFVFTGAMTPIITREFSQAYEIKDIESMRILFARYIPMLYSIATYFSIFIVFESENVLEIFTGDEFRNAFYVLIVMAFYPIHQTYGQLSGSIFYATGRTRLYRNIGVLGMFIGAALTIIFLFVLEMGALGLAMKLVIAQFITVNIHLFYNTKLLELKFVHFFKHQILAIIVFGTIAYISTSFVNMAAPFPDFILSGLLYTIFSVFVFFVYPSLFSISKTELSGIISNVRKRWS